MKRASHRDKIVALVNHHIGILVVVSIITAATAFGADWICKEAASEREGSAILACGIGTGDSEASARIQALKEAKREFDGICAVSADCNGHKLVLVPLRNDCQQVDGTYTCYRGIRFEISSEMNSSPDLDSQEALLEQEISATEEKLRKMREVKEKQEKLEQLQQQAASESDTEPPKKESPQERAKVLMEKLRNVNSDIVKIAKSNLAKVADIATILKSNNLIRKEFNAEIKRAKRRYKEQYISSNKDGYYVYTGRGKTLKKFLLNDATLLDNEIVAAHKKLEKDFPGLGDLRDPKSAPKDSQLYNRYLEDIPSIKAVLKEDLATQEGWEKWLLGCFDNNGSRLREKSCEELTVPCSEFRANEEGIFIDYFDENLNLQSAAISSEEDWMKWQEKKFTLIAISPSHYNIYARRQFLICFLAATLGITNTENYVGWPGEYDVDGHFHEPTWDEPPGDLTVFLPKSADSADLSSSVDFPTIKKECSGFNWTEIQKKLTAIRTNPRLKMDEFAAQSALNSLSKRTANCSETAQLVCRNVYDVRGQPALTYRTKDCRLRSVTSADIDNDVYQMQNAGITEADRLSHAQLKQLIEVCGDLNTAGFQWNYAAPSIRGCKPHASN